jgi:hypothetical protein
MENTLIDFTTAFQNLLTDLKRIAEDPDTPKHTAYHILNAVDKCGLDQAIKKASKPFNN